MSRGGEAFGRRPPPPPLILGPPHFSTQPPRSSFPTSPPKERGKVSGLRNDQLAENKLSSETNGRLNGSRPRGNGAEEENRQGNNPEFGGQSTKPLAKDVNAVFSKVGPESGTDSDAHPLLGITPAAPGKTATINFISNCI